MKETRTLATGFEQVKAVDQGQTWVVYVNNERHGQTVKLENDTIETIWARYSSENIHRLGKCK